MSFYDPTLVLDTGAAARTVSGANPGENVLDLSVALRDLGTGKPMYLNLNVTDTFQSATENSTTTFELLALPYSPPASPTFAGLTASVTATDVGDIITWTAHGLPAGTPVIFSVVGLSALVVNRVYYVTNPATNTFQLAKSLELALRGSFDTLLITAIGAGMTAIAIPQVLASSGPISVQGALSGVQNQGLLPIGTQLSIPLMSPIQYGLLGGNSGITLQGLLPRPTNRWGVLRVTNSATMGFGKIRAWLSHESVGARRYYPSGYRA